MLPVVAHVVADEGKHGHRVAADLADVAEGGGGHFGTHRSADVYAVRPVAGLEDEGHGGGAAAAEQDRGEGNAFRVLPFGVDRRALGGGSGEACVRVSALAATVRGPVIALPVDGVGGSGAVHAFPPDVAVVGQAYVGEDDIFLDGVHGDRVRLVGRAGSHAEVAVFRVDGVEGAVFMGPDPGDVVTDDGGLPAGFTVGGGGNEHGQVGLAAGGRECAAHIGLRAVRGFNAQKEHVFGHPLVLAGDGGGDAQGQALLAEQGVAAVTGTEGPDFFRFREVADVFFFVAGPRHVDLAVCKRGAHGVEAGNEGSVAVALRVAAALDFVFQTLENGFAHLGHDAHVDHDVGGVRDFNADLGQGGVQGTHAEGDHVHGTALHAALEEALQFGLHFNGVGPVVGRACVFFLLAADERAVFHTGHIGRGGTGEEASGALLGVQFDKGALFYHHVAKLIIFFLRAVAPIDGVGLAKLGDFVDPLLSCFVSGTHGGNSVCTEMAVGKSPVRLFMGRFGCSRRGNPVQGKALP